MTIRLKSVTSPGFSLVELMIALLLGLVLIGVVIHLFLGTRMTYMSNDALARVQENGRFALAVLNQDVREAGLSGFCAGELLVTNHLNSCGGIDTHLFHNPHAVFGYEFSGTGRFANFTIPANLNPAASAATLWTARIAGGANVNLPAPLVGRVVPGSDVLLLRRPEIVPAVTASSVSAPDQPIPLSGNHGLRANEIALITDCASGADLFQNVAAAPDRLSKWSAAAACGAALHPGNRQDWNWSTSYYPGMQLFRMRTHAYFVGFDPDRQEPGLFRMDLSTSTGSPPAPEELVGGVESMQVVYGMSRPHPDGDGQSVDLWLTASDVSDWGLVIAVRVALMVRSPENADATRVTRTFELSQTNVTSQQDGRLRQPFSTTIALRNRQIVW